MKWPIASFPGSSPTFCNQKVGEKYRSKATSIRGTGRLFRCYYLWCFYQKKAVAAGGDTDDLQARLDNLRRGDDD